MSTILHLTSFAGRANGSEADAAPPAIGGQVGIGGESAHCQRVNGDRTYCPRGDGVQQGVRTPDAYPSKAYKVSTIAKYLALDELFELNARVTNASGGSRVSLRITATTALLYQVKAGTYTVFQEVAYTPAVGADVDYALTVDDDNHIAATAAGVNLFSPFDTTVTEIGVAELVQTPYGQDGGVGKGFAATKIQVNALDGDESAVFRPYFLL